MKVTSPAFSLQGGQLCALHGFSSNSLQCWTINVGGLAGLWRMIHLLHQFASPDRPDVLTIQEACCSQDSWVGIHCKLDTLGYQSWYSGSSRGQKKHRGGVVIGVKSCIPAKPSFSGIFQHGQLLVVELNQLLVLGSYCPPDAEAIHSHCQWLHETWKGLQWRGHWIWAGDWNMPSDDIIGQVAHLCGGDYIGSTNCSTRWTSDRCIDFFLSTVEFSPTSARDEEISDHKIIQTSVVLNLNLTPEMRTTKRPQFFQPSWMSWEAWVEAFSLSWQHGEKRWLERSLW